MALMAPVSLEPALRGPVYTARVTLHYLLSPGVMGTFFLPQRAMADSSHTRECVSCLTCFWGRSPQRTRKYSNALSGFESGKLDMLVQ